MATTVARLEAVLRADTRQFTRSMDEAEHKTSTMGKAMGLAKGAAIGLAVTGVAVVTDALKKSIEAGIEAQKSQARLAVAFKDAHTAIGPYNKQIEELESRSRKLGFTDDAVRNSLGSLMTATHSYAQSVKALGIAQDLARFKGVDLEQATKALTMAHAGSLRPLKQLGLDISKVTTAQDALKASTKDHTSVTYKANLEYAKLQDRTATYENVLKVTTQAVHGQADAYSKTAAGAMEQFHAQVGHIEEAIGLKLLPVLTQTVQYVMAHWPEISATIKRIWMQDIKPVLEAWIELVKQVVATIRQHWSQIGPIVQSVAAMVKHYFGMAADVLKVFSDLLRGDWSKAWKDFRAAIGQALLLIWQDIKTYGKVGGLLWDAAKSVGEAILRAIWAGITGSWKWFRAQITNLFDPATIVGWIKSALGFASPSPYFVAIGTAMIHSIAHGVGMGKGILENAVKHLASRVLHGIGGLLHGGAASGSQNNRSLGQRMAAAYGWGHGAEWIALDALWQRESGWSNTAKNPSSGAYGIPQALPPTKLPPAGQESGGSSAEAQIGWGLNYIAGPRYGSPLAAWAHEQAVGWYDRGGFLPTGLSLALNTTGRPEPVGAVGGDTYVFNFPNYIGSRNELKTAMQQLGAQFARQNGRPLLGM